MKHAKKLVLFSLFALNLVEQPTPPVVIEQGILTGIVNGDGTILEYIGIPYGTANITNRFQAPYPPPKWEGTFKATEESSCPQLLSSFGVIGTEDCLKVNIYVPAKAKKPLPVMVFIHGGAFIFGSGGKLVYRPEFLLKHDVILVTINYRLGLLGFMCLGTKEAPGNAGIKDQIAALRWIKKNIAAFGGDPDSVTVFGESAGGTSVSILHAIRATEGLFEKAIVHSGSSVSNWALNRKPLDIVNLLVKALGHDTKDPKEIHEIFAKMPVKDILNIQARKTLNLFFDTQLLHLPCVEKPIDGVEAAIDDLPYNLLRSKPKNIPIMFGSMTKEGLFLAAEETEETLKDRNDKFLFASDLIFPNHDEAVALDKKLKQFYFGGKPISVDTRANITELYTQLYFELPEILETNYILETVNKPVYNFIFNYSGGRNVLKTKYGLNNETGACHADELLYLFNGNIWRFFRITDKDQQMIDWMTEMWTNFAKYGNPTPSSSNIPVKWEVSTKQQLKFLWIEDQLRMGSMPNPRGYQIWKEVYQKYRRKDLKYYIPDVKYKDLELTVTEQENKI